MKDTCNRLEISAISIYICIYATLFVLICVHAFRFKRLTKLHADEHYTHHLHLAIKYCLILFIGLAIKLYLVLNLFVYESKTLPINAILELAAIAFFAFYKTDEDCFKCF